MVERLKPKPDMSHYNGRGVYRRKLGRTPIKSRRPRAKGFHKTNRSGRKPGVPNKTTQILKDAILLAAECHGRDGRGLDGLVGYLTMAAHEEKKCFLALLGRVLPYTISVKTADNMRRIADQMTLQEASQIYMDSLRGLQQGLRTPLIDVTPNK